MSSLGPTFGAAFIGLVVSAIMYGLTLLQTFHYYRTYTRDPRLIKWWVGILWAADTLQLVLCTWAVYWYLVANFGNRTNLGIPHWSIELQTDASTTVGIGVQLYFARRVYQLSKNKPLTGAIIFFAVVHFALGAYFTAYSFIHKTFASYRNLIWVSCVGLGSAATADILIAGSLCYFLRKNRTGFARTDALITTLMAYSINTGLLTSIIATTATILYAAMPNNLVWISVFWMLGKSYINSFLAMLNSRDNLREIVQPKDGSIVQLSHIRDTVARESYAAKNVYTYPMDATKTLPPPLEVTVEMATEQRTDYVPSMGSSTDKADLA
ncbi:hypothetical protein BD410DRAFT_789754 [Rickenella mellea]|uniref:DUF6534 domain-containing protein n=1 Tax=Rickenella mellea TaxID=50990 RepID=A0A4Y7Q2E1_9AGAM|nr:hypothetical protein BD410DRAFT_789754 [Rickenella mellea]